MYIKYIGIHKEPVHMLYAELNLDIPSYYIITVIILTTKIVYLGFNFFKKQMRIMTSLVYACIIKMKSSSLIEMSSFL